MAAEGTKQRGETWYYYTNEPDATGARKKRWRRAVADGQPNTQAGASRARRARLRLLEDGYRPTQRTVSEYVAQYIAHRQNLRPVTRYTYTNALKRSIAPYIGDVPASKLTRADVREWHRQLLAAPYAPATITQAHNLVVAALSLAVSDDELTRNVAQMVTPPRVVPPAELPSWDEQRIAHFLTVAATDERMGALWIVLALTGLRIGEALALRWEDVDLSDARTAAIVVRQTLTKSLSGGVAVGPPKSTAGFRRVALPPEATQALRDHRDRQAFTGTNEWIFPRSDGSQPLKPSVARDRLIAFCARHNLPAMSPHELRHVHASWLLELRVNPKTILSRMGWTHLSLLDRYARLKPGAADALADDLTASIDAARNAVLDDDGSTARSNRL